MPASPLSPFTVRVVSGQTAVRDALAALLSGLKPLSLDIEEAGTVELVVAEVLNNIVEHAYPISDASGPIDIECVHRSDGLHLCITDTGAAMPDGQIPLGMRPDLDVDLQDMPEGGFGWFLIKDLAKDVTYERLGTRNQLKMRLAVAFAS
jgi:serine/threonine-protein kinase RsbW